MTLPLFIPKEDIIPGVAAKACSKCREIKSLEDFYSHKNYRSHPDGRSSACKQCVKATRGDYDTVKAVERVRLWRLAHPGLRTVERRRYVERYPEKARARNRIAASRSRVRRARAKGRATAVQIAARFAYFGNRCWMCGGLGNTIDHVIALSRGGTDWPSNIRPACKPCNSRKKDRSWRELAAA